MSFRKKLVVVLFVSAVAVIYFSAGQKFKTDKFNVTSMLGLKSASTGDQFWIEGENNKPSAPANAAPSVQGLPSFADVVDKVKDAVVNIKTDRKIKTGGGGRGMSPFGGQNPFGDFPGGDDFFRHFMPDMPREYRQQGQGSGFIISSEGYIVTNNHVVDKADTITVKLATGKEYKAEVIGTDPKTDVALIKIKDSGSLPVIKLGDSDKLRTGDWVIAIGNPFGLDQTVTAGIVSGKDRRTIGAGPYDDFIQTDAPINPGNSGGPLIDLQGNVVGINSMIYSQGTPGNIGIGFSIPVNLAKNILVQLKDKGKVTRGWIGVAIQGIDENIMKQFGLKTKDGALVGDVTAGGPAEKAGIKRGDVIVKVDGESVKSEKDLPIKIATMRPGKTVSLTIIRDGSEKNVSVTLGEFPEDAGQMKKSASREDTEEKIGIAVEAITPDIARELDLPDTKGVVISQVAQGSPAEQAGLRRGDVIREINKKEIKDTKDFAEAMSKAKLPEGILFLVQSNGMTHYVTIRAEQ